MLTQSLSAQFSEVLSFDSSSESFLHQSVALRKQLQLEEGPMAPEQSQLLLIQKHFHFWGHYFSHCGLCSTYPTIHLGTPIQLLVSTNMLMLLIPNQPIV